MIKPSIFIISKKARPVGLAFIDSKII